MRRRSPRTTRGVARELPSRARRTPRGASRGRAVGQARVSLSDAGPRPSNTTRVGGRRRAAAETHAERRSRGRGRGARRGSSSRPRRRRRRPWPRGRSETRRFVAFPPRSWGHIPRTREAGVSRREERGNVERFRPPEPSDSLGRTPRRRAVIGISSPGGAAPDVTDLTSTQTLSPRPPPAHTAARSARARARVLLAMPRLARAVRSVALRAFGARPAATAPAPLLLRRPLLSSAAGGGFLPRVVVRARLRRRREAAGRRPPRPPRPPPPLPPARSPRTPRPLRLGSPRPRPRPPSR